jgi:hypothetical protein
LVRSVLVVLVAEIVRVRPDKVGAVVAAVAARAF